MAETSNIDGDPQLLLGGSIKEEVSDPIDNPQPPECVVCVAESSENYDIFTTKTSSLKTPLHTFLSKFTNTELPFDRNLTKYICKTCLDLVNELEQAEIVYIQLKSDFEFIISKNPLFHLPMSISGLKSVRRDSGGSSDSDNQPLVVRAVDPIAEDPQCSQSMIVNIKKEPVDDGDFISCETLLKVEIQHDDVDPIGIEEEDKNTVTDVKPRTRGRPPGQKSKPNEKQAKKCHECSVCKRTFKYNSLLLIHLRTHTGEKPYECSECHKRFNQKIHLKNHSVTHGLSTPKPELCLECHICQKQFKRKHHLKEHLRIHSDDKPFKCELCSYSSIRKRDIVNHFTTHTGERPHECHICLRRFHFKSTLREHFRTHTGEKPYACKLCPRRFSHLHVLKSHTRTHTDEKPYECEICKQRFNQRSHLKSHMAIHTGEKPYACTLCARRFHRKRALEEHVRTHTGEKPFECHICLHRFAQRSNLLKHLRNHEKHKVMRVGKKNLPPPVTTADNLTDVASLPLVGWIEPQIEQEGHI